MSFQPFYDEETLKVDDPLAKLIRVIFLKHRFTTDDYVRLHGEFWNYWSREPNTLITHRNNQRRALLDKTISWKKFWFTVTSILRFHVVRISITVKDNSGQEVTYSSDELTSLIHSNTPHNPS